MTLVVFAAVYAAAAVFAVACMIRARQYVAAPVHLRWELYPVPHEEPEQAAHGGSRYEKGDWWTKPRRRNLAGELAAMVPEMLFLKGLHEFNRRLWYRSFPFHFGLYLAIGGTALLGASGLAAILLPSASGSRWIAAGERTGEAMAGLGALLAILGAAALLSARLRDVRLRRFTTAGDLFNLLFFITALSVLVAGLALSAERLSSAMVMRALLTADTSLELPALAGTGLILTALLAAYVPCTHMSHFIGKFFTYHRVRWDDAPLERGGRLEAKIAAYLTYRPTWSARHLGADGTKTWADIATSAPEEGAKR